MMFIFVMRVFGDKELCGLIRICIRHYSAAPASIWVRWSWMDFTSSAGT